MNAPTDPGANDECATCSHLRWRHREVDGQQVCTEYVDCACGGHFVEMSMATRMARFVEAAQKLPPAMAAVRAAMTEAFRAFHGMHTAMQQAGLLPDEEPGLCDGCDTVTSVTATDDGRAQLCASCMRVLDNPDIAFESNHSPVRRCPIDGAALASVHAQAGQPTLYRHRDGTTHPDLSVDLHATRMPALQQLATFHHVDCDRQCGGTCTQGRMTYPHATPRTQDDLQGPVPDMAELVASPRYAQHPNDTCPTCHPYACDPDDTGQLRSECRRRPQETSHDT